MISRKEFNNFTREMWNRLKMGEKKYGSEYKVGDIQQSILEEGVDLANYSFLLFLKTMEYNKKIKKFTRKNSTTKSNTKYLNTRC